MRLPDLIAITANLTQEVEQLLAERYERECSIIDSETRTSVDKQLQQAYSVWPDYKALVDRYDIKHAELAKYKVLLSSITQLNGMLSQEAIDEILAKVS